MLSNLAIFYQIKKLQVVQGELEWYPPKPVEM